MSLIAAPTRKLPARSIEPEKAQEHRVQFAEELPVSSAKTQKLLG
jgi:hypothetical protein